MTDDVSAEGRTGGILNTYRLVWEVLEPYERRRALLLLVMTIFMAVFEVVGVAMILPFLQVLADPDVIQRNSVLAWAWDTFGFTSERSFGVFIGIVAFAVILMSTVVRAVTTYALTRFAMMRTYALTSRLLIRYLGQPYGWFLNKNSASLGQNLLYETDKAVHECLLPALLLISNGFVTVLIAAFVFFVEPWVAIGATALLVCVYLVVYLGFRGSLDRLGASRYAANEERFRTVQEATGGIKDVKVQGLEGRFLARFQAPALRLARQETLAQTISKLPRYALEAVVYGGFILMVLVMLVTREGGITELLPLFGLIGMAGSKLFPALQQVYIMMSAMRYLGPALEAVHDNLTTLKPPVERSGPPPQPLHLRDRLEIRDVRFRYPGTAADTLDGLTADIAARTTIGVVGGTGAGKTTLIDIMLGLFAPDSGEIRVDGVTLTPDLLPSWQRAIGYVPQQIYLSDDSIAANIAFGLPKDEIDHAAVERAARVANLHEFVTGELPQGYATVVGERGVRLSGGQRQRIGIARALYHNPDVIILDEATSALDNLTERAVMEAVHNLSHEKTIIMIAHRLSTVRACDSIFLLERGRVIAQGTYDDLVSQNATFRRMAAQ